MQPDTDGGEFEHGEIVRGGLFVARGDTSEVFDLVEEALDEIALFVKLGIERTGLASVGLGRDIGGCSATFDPVSDAVGIVGVGIVGLVGQADAALLQRLEQRASGLAVVGLARGEREADRPAVRGGDGVKLGGQSSSGAAHATISTVFFELAAC